MGDFIRCGIAAFWLMFLPAFIGVPLMKKKHSYSVLESFFLGYVIMFASSEVLTLLLFCLNAKFHVLAYSLGAFFLFMAVLGAVLLLTGRRKWKPVAKEFPSLYLILAVLVVAAHLVVLFLYAHYDADDSFYVGASTASVYSDLIFRINPYTGFLFKEFPKRYLFSQYPLFAGIISKLALDLHPAMTAHLAINLIFTCIAYMVQYLLACRWFPEKKEQRGIYMLMIAVMTVFSGYSIKNAAEFQMVRIWQGKAFLAAAFLPLLFYMLLEFMKAEEERRFGFLILFLTNIACCYLSSMGVVLSAFVTGTMMVVNFVRNRKVKDVILLAATLLPAITIGLLYIFL
ncbi:MAG: hypothetical protein KBT01_07295 [Clostridiales bacterium]|nr:hypothetical protein [Candidatus Blautia equi]